MDNIHITPEHELLRDQIARFIASEVEPFAAAWEETGCVPREVLRKMGRNGLLGLMYDSQYGGAQADALTNLVFAEALSQSTFGGFIITALVHNLLTGGRLPGFAPLAEGRFIGARLAEYPDASIPR